MRVNEGKGVPASDCDSAQFWGPDEVGARYRYNVGSLRGSLVGVTQDLTPQLGVPMGRRGTPVQGPKLAWSSQDRAHPHAEKPQSV